MLLVSRKDINEVVLVEGDKVLTRCFRLVEERHAFLLSSLLAPLPSPPAQLHYNEIPIYVFLYWKLRSPSPNSHIHVSVSDLYISRNGPHIFLQQNRQIDHGNI